MNDCMTCEHKHRSSTTCLDKCIKPATVTDQFPDYKAQSLNSNFESKLRKESDDGEYGA